MAEFIIDSTMGIMFIQQDANYTASCIHTGCHGFGKTKLDALKSLVKSICVKHIVDAKLGLTTDCERFETTVLSGLWNRFMLANSTTEDVPDFIMDDILAEVQPDMVGVKLARGYRCIEVR